MTASLDRKAFFDAVRRTPFNGGLTASQVTGMDAMLDTALPGMDLMALAYCFATAHHETGGAMIPKVENLNYSTASRLRQVWPKRFPTLASAEPYVRNPQALANKVYGGRLGNTKPNDGWDFRGMGLVQATGRDNARRATGRLRELGYLAAGEDLEKTPSRMLDPDVSASMLFVGLSEGWYTGKKLADYFGPGRENPSNARAMVNPDANGPTIAAIYTAFKTALKAAGYEPNAVTPSIPVPPVTVAPVPPVSPAPLVQPAPRNSGVLPDLKPLQEATVVATPLMGLAPRVVADAALVRVNAMSTEAWKPPVEQQYYPGLADAARRAYRRSIDAIRDAAKEKGYAIGVHGSIARDIDLIAVPWTADAVSAEDLAEALHAAIAATNEGWAFVNPKPKVGEKPHGRMCWSIHIHGGPYFDISVMPRL